ncbi:hypothetical protein [Pleionea mediterranea]|uniref:Uncharacterized protein n=1 Tax=Pleionea mediterranea TaxID=523701 RepID=A0A316FD98_9GAMM|nr:hypothetical protein [Pleionea mediterranea]PWK46403.1 hypothetical protein C8D97_11388 [Pleionea mediterranea]
MDETEKLVEKHLKYYGYSQIDFEPDGNVPPDFLVDNRIAIEVRRLNQNHFNGNHVKGLEEVSIPLWHRFKALVESSGAPLDGDSWFVYLRFSRPVEKWKTLRVTLENALDNFKNTSDKRSRVIAKGKGFELEVWCRTDVPQDTMFVMAGCSDEESGGWLLPQMQINLEHCVQEKLKKISKVKEKYPEWWLVLADHIGFGLDVSERDIFRNQVSVDHNWDKIILIDPRDHTRWFEI